MGRFGRERTEREGLSHIIHDAVLYSPLSFAKNAGWACLRIKINHRHVLHILFACMSTCHVVLTGHACRRRDCKFRHIANPAQIASKTHGVCFYAALNSLFSGFVRCCPFAARGAVMSIDASRGGLRISQPRTTSSISLKKCRNLFE